MQVLQGGFCTMADRSLTSQLSFSVEASKDGPGNRVCLILKILNSRKDVCFLAYPNASLPCSLGVLQRTAVFGSSTTSLPANLSHPLWGHPSAFSL